MSDIRLRLLGAHFEDTHQFGGKLSECPKLAKLGTAIAELARDSA